MNDQVKRFQELTLKQQKKIKALEQENQHLTTLTQHLEQRIRDLEKTRMAIEFATADIPVDLDLIPEDAGKYQEDNQR